MHSSNLLSIFLLAVTALAADLPAPAHPPQRHGAKKYTLAKRQGSGNSIGIGSSCYAITGNPDDVICEIAGENVSCAPVCCERNGVFVDGCPAGDKCVFESGTLKCCPIPSATPTCATREEGGIVCTGEGLAVGTTTSPTPSAFILRPTIPFPDPTEAVPTSEPSITSSTGDDDDNTTTMMGTETGMEIEATSVVVSASRGGGMPSGTLNLPESAMPTDEGGLWVEVRRRVRQVRWFVIMWLG
ncbi:uncharacterized protein DFL_000097 [Arthrobotrys flagrans]|uniref:Uncharacterized protein n=1 Tax=Arthrobotrys flagrans TaxID=97331 RepID=A0A437ACS4_ARTFL|nr:hypothetical protein DFL_000097 [Arthrobotrys flagrans]